MKTLFSLSALLSHPQDGELSQLLRLHLFPPQWRGKRVLVDGRRGRGGEKDEKEQIVQWGNIHLWRRRRGIWVWSGQERLL
jgi:hypothetical protein